MHTSGAFWQSKNFGRGFVGDEPLSGKLENNQVVDIFIVLTRTLAK